MRLEEHTLLQLELDGLKENTVKLYKLAFRHLKDVYGTDYNILKLNRSIVDDIKRHLLKKEKPTGREGINTYCRTLQAAFERILIEGVIDKNPFYKFKRMPVRKDKKIFMESEEAQKFLKVVDNTKDENIKRIVKILLFTGIRRGEVLSIERADVSLLNRKYKAVNIKSDDKHKVLRGIPDEVFEDFEYFIKRSESEKPFSVCKPDTLTHWVKKLLREAGLSEDLHCHTLRHTFITLGLENGNTSIREMQKYIDHSSSAVTEGYAHDKTEKVPKMGL